MSTRLLQARSHQLSIGYNRRDIGRQSHPGPAELRLHRQPPAQDLDRMAQEHKTRFRMQGRATLMIQ